MPYKVHTGLIVYSLASKSAKIHPANESLTLYPRSYVLHISIIQFGKICRETKVIGDWISPRSRFFLDNEAGDPDHLTAFLFYLEMRH